jgi:hypothetical protein
MSSISMCFKIGNEQADGIKKATEILASKRSAPILTGGAS